MDDNIYEHYDSQKRASSIVELVNYPDEKRSRLESLIPKIETEFLKLRTMFDFEMALAFEKLRMQIKNGVNPEDYGFRMQNIDNYPVGSCNPITQGVLERVDQKNSELLFELKKEGYVMKRVFGIHKNKEFLNAIQLGHLFINVAVDSDSDEDKKIELHQIDQAPFELINDYDSFLSIAESYWELDIYPNHKFPLLSFLFPYITVDKEGDVGFAEAQIRNIVPLEVRNNFSQTQEFLFNSKYSDKKLNGELSDLLLEKVRYGVAETINDFPSYPRKFLNMFKQYAKNHDIFKESFDKALSGRKEHPEDVDDVLYVVSLRIFRHMEKYNI